MFGLDVWIEGSSYDEPAPHLSISIGDPNGIYISLSFSTFKNGSVYIDDTPSGQIIRLLKTASYEEDLKIFRDLIDQKEIDNTKFYLWDYTCIGYTKEKFNYIKNKYKLKEITNFTKRKNIPRNKANWLSSPSITN